MTLLCGALTADGNTVDVRLSGELVAEVRPAGTIAALEHEETVDLDGWLLLPAPAEPHAHLDKALTADLVDNPAGDLLGAVAAWEQGCASFGPDDIAERARTALLRLLASGATAVRSHVNVNAATGLVALEALVGVRASLAGIVDLQLVALTGIPTDPGLARAAVELGVDVVGGCPHLDPDPSGCMRHAVELAAEHGLMLDLHTDETLDPSVLHLAELAHLVSAHGLEGATASHCVSLAVQAPEVQDRVAAAVAEARLAVVCLPQTNLYLQARGRRQAPPRGLTALRTLLAAGVTVAAGADNLQDPFITVGRADPLETAALAVMAGHLTPGEAYHAVSAAARAAMGLPAVSLTPGSPAELLGVRASSVRSAIADAPADRIVIAKGRVVARTTTCQELAVG